MKIQKISNNQSDGFLTQVKDILVNEFDENYDNIMD